MYKQLLDGHKACKTTLSLTQYQREELIGRKAGSHDPIFESVFFSGVVSAHRNVDLRQ